MDAQISAEIDALRSLNGTQLRRKYLEWFGETTTSPNKEQTLRRLAWRLQARAEGGLSERARKRAAELAEDSELRALPPRSYAMPAASPAPTVVETAGGEPSCRDPRLPAPGGVLAREFRGEQIIVRVLPEGFEYAGRLFRSLSAVAREVTGAAWNGYVFFGLQR
jgi:hypothetical protein